MKRREFSKKVFEKKKVSEKSFSREQNSREKKGDFLKTEGGILGKRSRKEDRWEKRPEGNLWKKNPEKKIPKKKIPRERVPRKRIPGRKVLTEREKRCCSRST